MYACHASEIPNAHDFVTMQAARQLSEIVNCAGGVH
jgi:phenylpropionate dioxygenase-like ring-hydroxylating dioxygenase large terminal subunit